MIRRNSAPGRDGVEYIMLKNLTEEMKNILLNIYNEIWFTGEIPDAWKKYQVVFIDKPGKEKIRPIALSLCIGKLMERLVNDWSGGRNTKVNLREIKMASDEVGLVLKT